MTVDASKPRLRKLLVIGASVRAAAYSIMRAGLQPIAADMFCDVDLRAVCECRRMVSYPDDALRILRDTDADAWMYVGGMENHPALVDRLAQNLPLLGNAGKVLRNVRNPWRVAAVLQEHDVFAAEIMPPGMLPSDRNWMRKPLRSCGGIGVSDWKPAAGDENGSTDYAAGSFVFQRRIEGRALSALFIADGQRSQLIGISEQLIGTPWLGARGYAYAGSIGPVSFGNAGTQQFQQIGEVLTARFGLRGVFGVDAIWDGANVWPIEANPRYTASVEVMECALGLSVIDNHVKACQARRPTISLPKRPAYVAGKAIIYAERDIEISPQLSDFIQAVNREKSTTTLADIPTRGSRIVQGRPVFTLLSRAATVQLVRRRLQETARQVDGLLYPEGVARS